MVKKEKYRKILYYVWENEKLYISQLCRMIGLTFSYSNNLVNDLVNLSILNKNKIGRNCYITIKSNKKRDIEEYMTYYCKIIHIENKLFK